jgi:hypothetical protein
VAQICIGANITQLPGSERAWIDVFICREQQVDASTEIAFMLSPAALCALCALDLPIEFTTDVIVTDAIKTQPAPSQV